jgi:small subunit ribosomal protein S15
MAKMYSGSRGKSGSKKPLKKSVPSWTRLGAKEAEMLIAKLAKEGNGASYIGLMLRDKYGIPDVESLCGRSITKILKDKKQLPELPEDLTALMRRAAAINKHLTENKHDMTAHRGLILTESKIKRLVKYYKTQGRIPENWKYNIEQASYLLG